MCGTCGCSNDVKATVTDAATGEHSHLYRDGRTSSAHRHEHGPSEPHGGSPSLSEHDHAHGHAHGDAHHAHHAHHHHGPSEGGAAVQTVDVQAAILGKNDALAARNRAWFAGRQVLALNLVSSPGSGKTSLLERTIRDLAGERWIGVIEGDQQTMLDAERIRATGAPSVQVNTGTGCHLEADMVWEALRILHPPVGGLVLIENVGNLVCPALFDLGEAAKVAVLSVTEGEDKPAKYPHMFRESALILLNKIDLLPYLDFDLDRCVRLAREVNPDVEVMPLSVKSGAGLEPWYAWLRSRAGELEQRAFA